VAVPPRLANVDDDNDVTLGTFGGLSSVKRKEK